MIENIVQTKDGYRAMIDGVEWNVPAGHRFVSLIEEAIQNGSPVSQEEETQAIPELTFPQLLFGLVTDSFITEAEANDWLVNRVLPAAIEGVISNLPGPQQILARARALQPSLILFSDPMVQGLGGTEAFFRTYSKV